MFGDDAQHAWPRWGEYDILDTWQGWQGELGSLGKVRKVKMLLIVRCVSFWQVLSGLFERFSEYVTIRFQPD